MEYDKINTLFKRDDRNIIIPGEYTSPEFEWLKDCKWEATEKIDGTNTRIELTRTATIVDGVATEVKWGCVFGGRTERAQMPQPLTDRLHNIFDNVDWDSVFDDLQPAENISITIFGEGFGKKIQKDGGRYIKDGVDFIVFDVRVGGWWLKRDAVKDIACKLGLKVVPLVGYMTIPEAIEYVKRGFKSVVSEDNELDAEGLVLKTPDGLQFRNGKRIITKIKTKDFRAFRKAYPTDLDALKQVPNPNYQGV